VSSQSDIEWTDATWNPVRGCVEISPGCDHCYARTFAERFRGVEGHPYEQGFDLRIVPEMLDAPARWSRSRTVFVNSMSDLFQKGVPERYVGACFEVMQRANWHVYQVLTKRAARMRKQVESLPQHLRGLPNIWLGVTVEDRRHGLPRIQQLRETEAEVRFLSIEPLIEDLGELELDGIDWVIVGGESGPGCRPLRAEWVRSLRDQCVAAKVPFFFKQWGGLRKKIAGRLLDGVEHNAMPTISVAAVPHAKVRAGIVREVGAIAAEQRRLMEAAA
jgi:protein gp37